MVSRLTRLVQNIFKQHDRVALIKASDMLRGGENGEKKMNGKAEHEE